MNTILKQFKINKEDYNVIKSETVSYYDGLKLTYIYIETPKNCFGYNDYIDLDKYYNYEEGRYIYYVRSHYRNHNSRIEKTCLKYLLKYSMELNII